MGRLSPEEAVKPGGPLAHARPSPSHLHDLLLHLHAPTPGLAVGPLPPQPPAAQSGSRAPGVGGTVAPVPAGPSAVPACVLCSLGRPSLCPSPFC